MGATIPESLGLTGVVIGSVGVKGVVWTGNAEPLAPDSTGVLEADSIGVFGPVWTGAAEPLVSPGVETGVVTGVEGPVCTGAAEPFSPDPGVLDTGVMTGMVGPVCIGAAEPLSPDSIGVVAGTEASGVLDSGVV